MTEPRKHHYLFAHKFLPALFYRDPQRFVDNLRRGKTEMLRYLWELVGEREIEAESDRMPTDALGWQIKELEDDTTVVFVILPMPEFVAEAYFVAIVYRQPTGKLWKRQKGINRYITLEYGRDYQEGTLRTVLCEWTAKGNHINMGDGPEPSLKAFLKSVRAVIAGEKAVVAEFRPPGKKRGR